MVFGIPFGSSSSSALHKSLGVDRYEDWRITHARRLVWKQNHHGLALPSYMPVINGATKVQWFFLQASFQIS